MTQDSNRKNWWGNHQLVTQGETSFQIGPLRLNLLSQGNDLWVRWSRSHDWQPDAGKNQTAEESFRFLFPTTRNDITLSPALPDRAVSTRFETALRILPNDEVRFYVASPMWVQLKPDNISSALDIPTWRLSDTWFGTPTSGELGYSGLLPAYFKREQLPQRLDLALTPVNLRNSGSETLVVERLSIPSNHLALYYSDDRGFWTDGVNVEHMPDTELSNVRYDRRAPAEAERARQIAAPRLGEHETNSVARVFNALKHKGLNF